MGKHNNRYDKRKGVSEKVSTKLSKRLDEKSMSETLSISCMKNPVEYASKHTNKKLRLKGISKAEKKLLTCGCEHVIINKKGRRKAALRPAEKGMMQCRLCGKIISPTIPTEEDRGRQSGSPDGRYAGSRRKRRSCNLCVRMASEDVAQVRGQDHQAGCQESGHPGQEAWQGQQ